MNYHYDTPSGGQFFANAYGQYYRLDLFTNFTFFLNDPVNGDGIQQSDRRVIYGGDHRIQAQRGSVGDAEHWDRRVSNQSGRYPRPAWDPNDEDADRHHHRQRYSRGVLCAVRQSGGAADCRGCGSSGGLRAETFTFDVSNRCATCAEQPAGRTSSGIVLPKMNLILGPWARTEFFVNYGEGFHSNDARSAVTPGSSPLARAKNYEVGVRSKPWGPEGVEFIATLWRFDLQSELVFVGDEGTTEIRGAEQTGGCGGGRARTSRGVRSMSTAA